MISRKGDISKRNFDVEYKKYKKYRKISRKLFSNNKKLSSRLPPISSTTRASIAPTKLEINESLTSPIGLEYMETLKILTSSLFKEEKVAEKSQIIKLLIENGINQEDIDKQLQLLVDKKMVAIIDDGKEPCKIQLLDKPNVDNK